MIKNVKVEIKDRDLAPLIKRIVGKKRPYLSFDITKGRLKLIFSPAVEEDVFDQMFFRFDLRDALETKLNGGDLPDLDDICLKFQEIVNRLHDLGYGLDKPTE